MLAARTRASHLQAPVGQRSTYRRHLSRLRPMIRCIPANGCTITRANSALRVGLRISQFRLSSRCAGPAGVFLATLHELVHVAVTETLQRVAVRQKMADLRRTGRSDGVHGSSPLRGTTLSQVSGRHLAGSRLRAGKCRDYAGFHVDRSKRWKRTDGLERLRQSYRGRPSQRVTSRPPLHE